MNLNAKALKFIILSLLLVQSCSVQKSRNDVSKTGLFFHNLTAKYNGYFNAKTLLDEAELILSESYKDDYNKILELYEYNGVADASSQSANLDLAIKKGSTLVNLHRPSHWVPDTYLLIGQAQYFKQTYETAEETFKYMVNNYDKLHISTKKKTKEQANKERAIRVREQQEKREEEKAAKEKEKKKADKTKEQQQKDRKKANKQKQKEREQYLKDRKKAAKAGKPLPPRPSTTSKPAAKDSVKTSPIVNKKTDKAKPEQKEKEEEGESLAQTAQKKGKPSKNHRPVLQDAQLWLAKTYIMRKNGIAASIVLSQLKSDPGLYEEIRPEIPVLQAYNHIKQEEYADAIPFLKEALETKGISNKKKARVAFVLGQLTALQKDAVSSYEAFNKVSDFHPSYDLQFFAKLYAAQQGVVSGKAKKEDLLNDLKKLTRDEKNIEFGTAIYHSMALVHLADGNREEAKATLIKGLSEKGDNTQKTESFYLMANMYYEDEDYLKAKNYFDSTLAVIGDKDIRKEEVSRYSQSLAEIARNLSIIQVQDSMLIVRDRKSVV